ncbi:MAG: hypothetical protein ACLTG8_04875 [Alistipes finegoldii]|uniref:hypothetical protein n=1 Tax=Alistipes finegoldii TaxID=214856 RepID=UPI0039938FEC
MRYARQQQPYVAQIAVEQYGVGRCEQQDEALKDGVFGEGRSRSRRQDTGRNEGRCRTEDLICRRVAPKRVGRAPQRAFQRKERQRVRCLRPGMQRIRRQRVRALRRGGAAGSAVRGVMFRAESPVPDRARVVSWAVSEVFAAVSVDG